jgi:thiosulfate/3-mercaptopyruvate sulfurtransferase
MTSRTSGFVMALVLLVAVAAFFSISGKLTGSSADGKDDLGQNMIPFSEIKNYDVFLDVSPNATQYISGAINLNYVEFFDQDKRLKSESELAKILGDAGISCNDSVVVYGECQPCGGGPSAATYTYWIMKYLGQKKIGLLNGGVDDWAAAKLPTEKKPVVRSKSNYTPKLRPEMLATYDFVKDSRAQIIDARTLQDRSVGSIPGSINISYDEVLEKNRLKDRSALGLLFSGLDKDRPVVVYSATGVKASMVCFALEFLGYNASLYTWNDWLTHKNYENASINRIPKGFSNATKIRL